MVASAPPAASSPELKQLKEMSFVFTTMRQSVDQLAASQQQMASDIAKLLADQQELLHNFSPSAAANRCPRAEACVGAIVGGALTVRWSRQHQSRRSRYVVRDCQWAGARPTRVHRYDGGPHSSRAKMHMPA
jgi:hypothetical protein